VLSVGGAGLAEEVKGEGGSRYLGEFRAGKAHGKGAAFLASGTSMRGTFADGMLHGEAEVPPPPPPPAPPVLSGHVSSFPLY